MIYETFTELDEQQLVDAAQLFEALAHPVRLRIVAGLLRGECCVGPMAECLGLPQPFVSRHLAILRDAGVLACENNGRQRVYRVVHPAAPALIALFLTQPPKESP